MVAVWKIAWAALHFPILGGSMLVNAATGGDIHVTVSARAAYAREAGSKGAARACHVFDWIDPRSGKVIDHCTRAIEQDRKRRHLP